MGKSQPICKSNLIAHTNVAFIGYQGEVTICVFNGLQVKCCTLNPHFHI